jgi:excisionase family DNA binding protein
MAEDLYFTIDEVATTLKVSYLTVYRWVQSKKITAFKVGKQYRIKKEDLDKFIESCKK